MEHWKRITVEGDGNCMFRCLSLAMKGSQEEHQLIRRDIAAHMRKNKEVYEAYVDSNYEKHITAMEKSTGGVEIWGTDAELQAATSVFQITINVHSKIDGKWIKQTFADQESSTNENIHLVLERQHYNILSGSDSDGSDVKNSDEEERHSQHTFYDVYLESLKAKQGQKKKKKGKKRAKQRDM